MNDIAAIDGKRVARTVLSIVPTSLEVNTTTITLDLEIPSACLDVENTRDEVWHMAVDSFNVGCLQ